MRPPRLALLLLLNVGLFALGCPAHFPPPGFDPDRRSGQDAKRSGAQVLRVNKPKTDEVSYRQQDRTDWYVVTLSGQPNVLATEIHWDNAKSDLMVDVFDEFGKQISASPTRAPGMTQKSLLTQIDHPGVYYIRISAARPEDGTVYTMEAKWESAEVAPVDPKPLPPPPPPPPPRPKHHDPEPREPKEKPPAETIQGHIVGAYRDPETKQLTIQLDKGSSAGVKVGMSGTILSGASGEDPLTGGAFRVVQVVDGGKSIAKCALSSIGKNTRVAITVR